MGKGANRKPKTLRRLDAANFLCGSRIQALWIVQLCAGPYTETGVAFYIRSFAGVENGLGLGFGRAVGRSKP